MISFPRLHAYFTKSKRVEGWLSVRIQRSGDAFCFAHVVRPAQHRPVVSFCDTCSGDELEALAKERNFERYRISCLMNYGEYQMLPVEAPNVPREEMKAALRWRIKDLLDCDIEESTVDVIDIPQDENLSAKDHSIIAVSARNEIIRDRMALFEKHGMPLSAIDIPELAQRNIAALFEDDGKGIAMLSFDEESGLLTFSCAGELCLARRIDVTLPQLLEGGEEGKAPIDRITLELQRSIDHFERQFHYIPLTWLLLAPLPQSGGMQDHLAANLSIPVKTADLNEVFDLPETLSLEQQSQCFLALGGALRQEAS